jgi:hypothetical protein
MSFPSSREARDLSRLVAMVDAQIETMSFHRFPFLTNNLA